MNQTGKMSAEPPRIENKRDRRRGAAGRAAALRRAPSDSDCSGETASLSADSGERTARQQLPPPRSGKTRNRRRGSEWEVLEGLKDGQRFDKRPDVFNGYLHKKRKWPLKGWHKRFFVIDGGILVYARSPADVARGRLHGSVDVGLSVISAKARRRRIDIDADEFIYHLRAKTPEVFRTWLNILKAHRLYRQHLLTFGARESIPKIHAPNDDLPPTDTSSHTTFSTSNTTSSEDENFNTNIPFSASNIDPSINNNKQQNSINKWLFKNDTDSGLIPLNLELLENKSFDLKFDHLCHTTGPSSLCSMKCVSKRLVDDLSKKHSLNISLNSTDAEKQMLCTEINSFPNANPGVKSVLTRKYRPPIKNNLFVQQQKPQTTTCFFFTKKKYHYDKSDSLMKKSRKCTNLVKYRNVAHEPPLKKPSSRCLLLGKYSAGNHIELTKVEKPTKHKHVEVTAIPRPITTVNVQIDNTRSMVSQNVMTMSDYDKITQDLMKKLFKGRIDPNKEDMKYYVDQIVRDLYDVQLDKSPHPVKTLFRALLEYWLKNTSITEFRAAMMNCHCVDKPSNKYFMRDKKVSNYEVKTHKQEKETQFHGVSEIVLRYKANTETKQILAPHKVTKKAETTREFTRRQKESFEKERRIQQLERLLKNTVYICETNKNNVCREKDIKITRKLIDNLEKKKLDSKISNENILAKSSSSTELPEIQDTINHLISDTALPPDVAKEFLGAYLDVLLHDISTSTATTMSSDWSSPSKEMPNVEVLTEAVTKKVSKSILTLKVSDQTGDTVSVDPGQIYLKEILDKITTMFSKVKKPIESLGKEEKLKEVKTMDDKADNTIKDELGNAVMKSSKNNLIYENYDENSLVIDLSKYNLENIAMFQDQTSKDMMSITIRLKEKPIPPSHAETNQTRLNLKFSDNSKIKIGEGKHDSDWISFIDDTSTEFFRSKTDKKLNPNLNNEKDIIDFKPYFSNSDATSKAYGPLHQASMDSKIDSLKDVSLDLNDNNQCYMMSIKKGLTSNLQSKKNDKPTRNTNLTFNARNHSVVKPRVKKPEELRIFEKPAPRIIDEKFILLLLENLMLLSKNVPALYKDINTLYLKLRKKHEKVIKNCSNIQGLSLLGKIYNEEPGSKLTQNIATQYDSNISQNDVDLLRSFGTNTYNLVSDKSVVTEEGSYYHTPLTTPLRNNTEEEYKIINSRNDSDKVNSNNNSNKAVIPDNLNEAANQAKNVENNNSNKAVIPGNLNEAANQTKNVENNNSNKAVIPDNLNDAANQTKNVENNNSNKAVIPDNLNDAGNQTKNDKHCNLNYFKPNDVKVFNQINFDSNNNPNTLNVTSKSCNLEKIHLYKAVVHPNDKDKAINKNFGKTNPNSDKNNVDSDKTNANSDKINTGLEKSKPSTSRQGRTITDMENIDVDSVDESISVQNWMKRRTKDCTIGTLLKYVFEREGSFNYKVKAARPIQVEADMLKQKGQLSRMKQKLLKELYQTPVLRVSTHSQTDRHLMQYTLDKRYEKDYDVYQIFLSKRYNLKGSCSEVNIETNKSDDLNTLYRCSSGPSCYSESGGPLENVSRELGQAHLSVQQLQRLLDALELQQQVHHDTDVSLEGASPNVKKDRRKFGLRKKKSNSKCASVELAPPHIDPSASHSALSALTAPPSPGGGASSIPNSAASLPIACAAARPQSLPGAESLATAPGPASLTSLTPDHQLREDFNVLAKDLVTSLKGIVTTLVCERGRLRAAMEAAEATPSSGVVAALRTNLSTALHQNSELRSRLSRIHDASDLAEICSVGNNSDAAARQFQQSLSYSSSCVSASEFFDAEEHDDDHDQDDVMPADEAGVIELDGDSSSEAGSLSSEEGSASSDNSDGAMASAEAVTLRSSEPEPSGWSRRTRLPAPRPVAGGPSLWNLLYKNIGKDLSQISMPVTINEPLNMLQRLCEELEYCELLDAAASARDAIERTALVAAFAVSAYAAAAHRAASKPFNPLLAETYECVRDDKGFRFLAEQVSHHPPISACHAESPRWCFWQEARIKTKFWGKSMEFQPTGRVHVRLNTTGDHYTWNKVTTCVHNLFGGQRWVDQYGDMHITCLGTDITCKLSFIKASSWSHSRHEIRGAVSSGRGARLRLAGRWSEALYAGDPPAARCLWRPGAMPPEHEMYYGFTRFAMELNEMEPGMKEVLPHTDTRFRPDQRALEEGDVETAETLKHELEQAQRERRRDNAHHTPAWFRKTLEDGEETWVFSDEYWKARENGFPEDIAPRIW